jgi:hypothetical protein
MVFHSLWLRASLPTHHSVPSSHLVSRYIIRVDETALLNNKCVVTSPDHLQDASPPVGGGGHESKHRRVCPCVVTSAAVA